jgi:hypothetical protein
MNKRKKIINIIIFGIAIILIPVFFILYKKQQSGIMLLLAAFLIGYVIVELVKFRIKKNDLALNDFVMLVIAILTIIFTFVPFNQQPVKEQLNRLYFPKDSINFDTEIKVQNLNFQKFIFAFDNSGEGLTDNIDKKLHEQYSTYCTEIETFQHCAQEDMNNIRKFSDNKTYVNLLKASLCCYLIQRNNGKGEFLIKKIGDANANWHEDFQPFEKENIEKVIKKILQTNNNEFYTNFHIFNQELINIKNCIKENEQMILFTYSDFFHDCGQSIDTDELKQIRKSKQSIIRDIVHNCFIDMHNRPKGKRRSGTYILDSAPDFAYEKFFFIDLINDEEKVPIQIFISNDNHWYYSHKYEKDDIETIFTLNFSPSEKSIVSHNTIDTKSKDTKKFYVNGNLINKDDIKHFGKNDNIIRLEYKGKKIPIEETLFEIRCDDNIHYYVYFDFIKEWNNGWRYWLPILAFVSGLMLGLFEIKKI